MPTSSTTTTCCVAGGGPAGLMLGLLLARAGVDTIVLEKHADFFRDFRGDTIHPSTLDLLDQLGLRDRFDAIGHSQIRALDVVVNGNRLTPVDFSHLRGKNRFVALMPQWDFLSLLAEEGQKYPNFRLMMGASATELVRHGDRITGVRVHTTDGPLTIEAALTVAADGRDSALRDDAGLVPRGYGIDVDLLWFRLPRTTVHPPDTLAYLDAESMIITIPRTDYYQSGMLIPKGEFEDIRRDGLGEFRARIARAAPFLGEVTGTLTEWNQVKLLTIEVNRLDQWWLDGLLCIGDAAHAMSPAFGVGVNYAVQDAVATANLLVDSLRNGTVSTGELQSVQRRRYSPVARMQPIQLRLHEVIAKPGGGAFLANPMRWWQRAIACVVLPIARRVTARIVGRGFRPEKIGPQLDPRVVGR